MKKETEVSTTENRLSENEKNGAENAESGPEKINVGFFSEIENRKRNENGKCYDFLEDFKLS